MCSAYRICACWMLWAEGVRGVGTSVWTTLLHFPSLEQLRIGRMQNRDVPPLDGVTAELITGLHQLHTLVLEPTLGHDTPISLFWELHRCPSLTSLRYRERMRWYWGQAPAPIGLQSALQCVARCTRLRELFILNPMNLSVQWIPFCCEGITMMTSKLRISRSLSPRIHAIHHCVDPLWLCGFERRHLATARFTTLLWTELSCKP